MSNEGRNFTISTSKGDTLVYSAREMRNSILKVMVSNLHDVFNLIQYNVESRKMGQLTRLVLDDGQLG